MAKRKRLDVPTEPVSSGLETKSAFPAPRARMPIADVAGDTAGRAALEEVAREMGAAEEQGRIVKALPIEKIAVHHLARDRMVLDEDEMAALVASMKTRGQQTPIEVLQLNGGEFGLISGLRRVAALREIGQSHVLALVKRPESSRDAYQAMVEENEIRSNLSFFERAQIAVAAVGQGVYPDVRAAVKGLYAHAPKAKRSKINKFVTLCETVGATLRFPTAIPEHLGVKLGQAIEADRAVAIRISKALKAAVPQDAAAERRVLERALAVPEAPKATRVSLGPGLQLESRAGRAVLSGKAVDADFLKALEVWAKSQG